MNRLRPLLLLLASLPLAGATPGLLPRCRADGGGQAGAKQDDGGFLPGETQKVEHPPLVVTRPSDSWRFVDLARMRAEASEAGQDVSGFRDLKARLYQGATKANIYVYAWVDQLQRRAPPSAASLALGMIEDLKPYFTAMHVKRPSRVRVGHLAGVLFQVTGHHKQLGRDHAILKAVVYRPEDRAIVTFSLECTPDALRHLRKDFLELLGKARV